MIELFRLLLAFSSTTIFKEIIGVIKVVVDSIKLARQKQQRAERVEKLREAIDYAKTNKDTSKIEDYLRRDN